MEKNPVKIQSYERIVEITTWTIMVLIIFGVRFLPIKLLDTSQVYILIGAIISFVLLYYLVIYKYFSREKRFYLKTIADIVLIGVLIHVLKDYGQYFFALYFLPIAAAALELEFINALIIATVASIFVAFEVFLGSQDLLPKTAELYQGAWEIGLILLMTIFCRALALEIRQERSAKEEAQARQKVLEEEAGRQKEFLSLTSHQLYTPLSIIRGFISTLHEKKYGQLNPKQTDAINEVYANTKRMTALVSELLSISRIQTGAFELKLEKCQLEDLIENIIKQFKESQPKKNVELIFHKDSLQPLLIDNDKIRCVINNLIDNALKYTGKGKIEVVVEQNTEQTTLKVIDQGIGIKEEDFDKLFQAFFRGKNILELDNSGTGLGLYIARLIVEKHGGKIWAENNPPAGGRKGATFGFNIPNKSNRDVRSAP